jgi:hypothetical protein
MRISETACDSRYIRVRSFRKFKDKLRISINSYRPGYLFRRMPEFTLTCSRGVFELDSNPAPETVSLRIVNSISNVWRANLHTLCGESQGLPGLPREAGRTRGNPAETQPQVSLPSSMVNGPSSSFLPPMSSTRRIEPRSFLKFNPRLAQASPSTFRPSSHETFRLPTFVFTPLEKKST